MDKIKIKDSKRYIIQVIAVIFSLWTLYFTMFGTIPGMVLRVSHLMFASVLCFTMVPVTKSFVTGRKFIINNILTGILIAGTLVAGLYIAIKSQNLVGIQDSLGVPTYIDKIMAVIMIIVVLEMARRTVGLGLTLVTIFFILYTFLGSYIPGNFGHRSPSIGRMLSTYYLSQSGILSFVLGLSASFVFLFVLFAAFIQNSYATEFLMDMAFGLTKRLRGGPAQAAVVSSAFMGSLSGAATANVVGTGSITIPLMKKTGFKPHVAAAIEAAASTGGGITPPMLGAAAFIIAEWLSIPYIEIVKISIVPAILYFASVGAFIHFRSIKLDIKIEPPSIKPLQIMKNGIHFVVPVIFVVYFLARNYTPSLAAFAGIVSLIAISFVRKHSRMTVKNILKALESGAKNIVPVAAAMACVGIIIGSIGITGIGIKFSNMIVSAAGTSLLLTLIYISLAALVLGMGLPITAAYITLAIFAGPALESMGLPILVAHMIIFWLSQTSAVTPPVCITSYAAAGIAKASPMKTAFYGFRLAVGLFAIPLFFAYTPLITGSAFEIMYTGFFILLGIIAFSSFAERYFLQKLNIIEMILMISTTGLLFYPNIITNLSGVILFTGLIGVQVFKRKMHKVS